MSSTAFWDEPLCDILKDRLFLCGYIITGGADEDGTIPRAVPGQFHPVEWYFVRAWRRGDDCSGEPAGHRFQPRYPAHSVQSLLQVSWPGSEESRLGFPDARDGDQAT